MATLTEVAMKVLADLGIDGHEVLASQWARDKYIDLLADGKLNQAKRYGTLTLPANITSGTVSITTATQTVTGDSDAQTAWQGTDFTDGWYFRGSTVWYRITGQTASTLTLHAPYSQDTVSSGSYVLRKIDFTLPTEVKRLGTFTHPRLHQSFEVVDIGHIIHADPARVTVTGGPAVIADKGVSGTGQKVLEIYPGSDQAETIDYVYWIIPDPRTMKFGDPLPEVVSSAQLEEGVKIKAYEWQANNMMTVGQFEGAALYRNWADRQRTIWEKVKQELRRQDGAFERQTVVATMPKPATRRDIMTAEDQVWTTPLGS